MAKTLDLTCRCGAVHLEIAVPRQSAGTRIKCYCKDCQTSARSLGATEEILDPAGGTDVWQTTPDLIKIASGAEHLRILRLSPRGLYRWYAGCCDTPMCNTLTRLGVPFAAAILSAAAQETAKPVTGPVFAHVNTTGAIRGKGAPAKDIRLGRAGLDVLRRMAVAFLAGRASQTPFRNDDGTPIAPKRVLSKAERDAARP